MAKTPKQIKISPEAEQMLEEIRDNNRRFNLSVAVEALIRSLHADIVKTTK